MIGAARNPEVGATMALRIRLLAVCWIAAALLAVPFVSTAGAQVLDLTAQPSLYPAFDPSVTDYVVRCAGSPVDLTVSAPAGTEVDVDGQGPRGGNFTARVSLSEGQGFRITAASGSSTSDYRVRCIPSDFPGWTFQRSGQPQAEWYTIAPSITLTPQTLPASVSRRYVAIFDTNGVPVWWAKVQPPLATDFHMLSNGDVGWNEFDQSGVEEHRLDGSLVRHVAAVGGPTDAHEFILLPNGNYLITSARFLSTTTFTLCGQSNVPVFDNGVQEIAPDGTAVWSWWASEHIPMSEVPSAWCPAALLNNGYWDPYHINSIEPDGDGYVVSFRHLDAVYRIKKDDGSFTWKLGGVQRPESLTVRNDPIFAAGDGLRGQHDARLLANGTLSVHDNGYHPESGRAPRAVRYSLNLGARTATLVEQVNDPGSVDAALCCGSARKLSGGDWVMSWGSSKLITELSPAGNRVFSLTFDNDLFSYRAHPVPYGTLDRGALRAGMDAQYPRGYVRARGANKIRVSLVPAFSKCVAPDRAHGAPLAFGSCSAPSPASGFLTVGTPQANGAAANAVGFVVYTVHGGDPSTAANEADVSLRVKLSDVRRKDNLADYTGEVQLRQGVRITDRLNGSLQNEAATGFDTDLPATIPCSASLALTVGATCSLSSSFNAILPGSVIEGKRATWQLDRTQIFDGGSSGVAGSSGATLFETEGLFVP
jgi:hypothetical protein